MVKKVAEYGSWPSPVTADMIVAETIRLNQIQTDNGLVYWVEQRPTEAGRNVIVRYDSKTGISQDMTPPPFNVRTRVHEYGGGAYNVVNSTCIFSNDQDQNLYVQTSDDAPALINPNREKGLNHLRFADGVIDTYRNHYICVVEDHSVQHAEPRNYLATVSPDSCKVKVIAEGYDFYAAPRLSPDGSKLAWICWRHPDMPWDNTDLWVAEVLADGSLNNPEKLTSVSLESVFQPLWSPDNKLYCVSDRTNWWNIYKVQDSRLIPLLQRDAEFGLPMWVFGMSTYTFVDADTLFCSYFENHKWHLARLDIGSARMETYDLPFTEITGLQSDANNIYFLGGSPQQTTSIVALNYRTGDYSILRQSSDLQVPENNISQPQAFEFETENRLHAYAYYYPPQNSEYHGPDEQRPPLIVKSHGGPTGATATSLDWKVQYWTSRGFAVVDVNYRGSTGYGRIYREQLNEKWGVAEVQDCIRAAKYLADKALIDENKISIAGGSAGGYTVLCALTFHDYFNAGASYYGISELESMALDTHKFESRYLDKLVAPYPKSREIYYQRSPIHFTERLTCPIILMQGLEDKVVPPDQAEKMLNALLEKGIPVAYLAFEGEQHGFRKAENIKRSLEAELYFYSRIFYFPLSEDIEPVVIHNLDNK